MIKPACALILMLNCCALADDVLVVQWVKANAVPLKTAEAGNGLEDLQPIKSAIGNARIVSLGETTHGTREVFQMKHRMLEFLVKEMGFSVFGIEASIPDCIAINDYVLHGKGDPEKAVAGQGFWTWSTEEVLDMVKWMRAYNQDPSTKVKLKFYGFDMQQDVSAIHTAMTYLQKADPDAAAKFKPRVELVYTKRAVAGEMSADEMKGLLATVQDLARQFDQHRDAYVARTSKDEYATARRCVVVAGQALELAREMHVPGERDRTSIENVRDRCMAENVAWILENEPAGTKIVLWAHNWHVSVAEPKPGEGVLTMGSYLERRYKDDYLPIGFSFNQGSFQAIPAPQTKLIGLREWTVGPARDGWIDATFAKAGMPIFFLDLRSPPAGAVSEWMNEKHPMRAGGAIFNPEQETTMFAPPTRLAGTYDAIIFIDATTRARPLNTQPFSSMDPSSVAMAGRPRLGVRLRQPDDGKGGLVIEEVLAGQSAEAAGLQAGDRIVSVADQSIASLPDLRKATAKYNAGDTVPLTILRGEQQQKVHVTLKSPSSTQK
jgi:erythromycin esterase